jgi:hypothetical protein
MVQIYNEITIYNYKEIFPSGDSTSNPHQGPASPETPQEGVNPLYTPPCGGVYILQRCKVFMGYKHD